MIVVDPITGLLPPSGTPHTATMTEVEAAFVTHAPHSGTREDLFSCLCTWTNLAAKVFGSGRVWVDGGFVTHKQSPPHDVDIVFLPDEPELAIDALRNDDRAFTLLTLQDVFFMHPLNGGTLKRLQPVSGMVDAFLADPRDHAQMDVWHELWSSVKGPDGYIIDGQRKGYVEVRI